MNFDETFKLILKKSFDNLEASTFEAIKFRLTYIINYCILNGFYFCRDNLVAGSR